MEPKLRERRRIIIWGALAFLLSVLAVSMFGRTLSVVLTNRTISNAGTVKGIGVGVYWDLACTNRTASINWGVLEPNSNKTLIVYVRNEGNSIATLSKTTQNWNPSTALSYMILIWDYAGQTLNVNQVVQVKLTLVVSSTVSQMTAFSFDMVITATG